MTVYYHGGIPDLEIGDLLVPSRAHMEDGCLICMARAEGRTVTVAEYREWVRAQPVSAAKRNRVLKMLKGADGSEPIDPPSALIAVYITTNREYATQYAARSRGDLYEVEPNGEMTASDEDPFASWTVQSATVTRIVRRKVRLTKYERRAIFKSWKRADRRYAITGRPTP